MENRYYSQHGEDYILSELFQNQPSGYFVEIGCIDGRRFSNTLTFEDRGWHGLCIEAHGDYIAMLKNNRPGSLVCHFAVAMTDQDDVPFYANNRGSLSTLDCSKEYEFKTRFGRFFSGFEVQTVNQRRLDTIFQHYAISEVDILSIDVEGGETEVLTGLDLERYRPRVMVIEADNPGDEQKLDGILLNAGYSKSLKIINNVFYLLDKSMENVLKNRKHLGMLVHTQHPLDNDGDKLIPFSFDF